MGQLMAMMKGAQRLQGKREETAGSKRESSVNSMLEAMEKYQQFRGQSGMQRMKSLLMSGRGR